jgi:Protein of unknown function C-terminus (DUF2451)
MQLDFTQFSSKLEKIAELRPIPGKDFVEQYVKAYYLPESALETWIKAHKVRLYIAESLNYSYSNDFCFRNIQANNWPH